MGCVEMKPNNMLWVNNWLGVVILELGFVFHGGGKGEGAVTFSTRQR